MGGQSAPAVSATVRPGAKALPTFTGLTEAEAARRAEQGQANTMLDVSSRSVGDILKANLLTRFNALLGSMLLVILVVGPLQDAVFGLILVANALIGIGQELRAKLTLDRLAVLVAPKATVQRDGRPKRVPVAAVVEGDVVLVEAGDEVVVDGLLESDEPIELNEALLTGESTPVTKSRGAEVLAGSFVSAGRGGYRATRVGEASYARRLTAEARRFQLVRSELMAGINRILRVVTWIVVPTAGLLVISQLRASPSLPDAIRGSVAGVITLVPEGLVLLTSASLALAVVRLGRKKVLVQQLPAVEMLARTDVVCLDKTGTLTEAESSVETVEALSLDLPWREALGAVAHSDPSPNPSIRAIAARHPAPKGWGVEAAVPFSSSRKWSAVRFEGHGWWVLGAPDVLLTGADGLEQVARRADRISTSGWRAILLARAKLDASSRVISELEPAALVVLSEAIKPGAAETLQLLVQQGVAVKVLSGDHPATVAAIAARVGISPSADAVDGRSLPESGPELLAVVEGASIFGRLSPEQKRSVIRALHAAGHTVAMVGDGVNDVLALKEADIGIAMGRGSAAARAVAACVLVDGAFGGVPAMLAEGRRVIGNVERLASLFFTKTVYAFLLAVSVSWAMLPFPFLPRQLTLISAFTIGIPSVYLALAPNFEPSRSGFMKRVMRFAVPAGVVAAAATFAAYTLAVQESNVSISEERTVATVVIAAIGLWILARLARPLTKGRRGLLVAMVAGLATMLVLPPVRELFDLDFPRPIVAMSAVGIIAVAFLCLETGDRAVAFAGDRWRTRPPHKQARA
jgi:magnesium-transporting ATPase (P-type)